MSAPDEYADFPDAPAPKAAAAPSDEFSDFPDEPEKKAVAPKPENTWWGAVKGDADAAAALGSRAIVGPVAALARTANRAIPDWDNTRAAVKDRIDSAEKAFTYDPKTPEGQYALDKIGSVVQPIAKGVGEATGNVIGQENVPAAADIAGAIPALKMTTALGAVGRTVADTAKTAARVVKAPIDYTRELAYQSKRDAANTVNSQQSMGAARASVDPSTLRPPLRQAFREASQETGTVPNADAAERHAEADQHGVDLTEGQATRDAAQYSNEQNSTHPDIVKRLGDQNQQLTDAFDEIRRKAAPGHVANDPIENGQTAVDALKGYDEPIRADINAKYGAARAASAGGDLQMNGGSFVQNANTALKPQSKFRFLPAPVKGILDDVEQAGGRMSLDDYEAYDTQLGNEIAKARASGDGNAVAAVSKVRDALHAVDPADAETAAAKDLFRTARSAAKARFDAIDADPAYEAAVNDVSINGVKRGRPSTLADKFLDKYALQAPKANVDQLMEKLNPEAQQAVAAHTLSTIRNAAIGKTSVVAASGYEGAVSKYGTKLDSLISPETRESLDSLGRVIHNVKVAPPGHFVNYSKSGVISNAAHEVAQPIGEAVVNAHTLGMGVPVIKNIVNNKFAKRSLAPGAGLKNRPIGTDAPIGRATGGKVTDHDVLLKRLVGRWKAAKKHTDKATEPLLKMPDASIVKALEIAQEHI